MLKPVVKQTFKSVNTPKAPRSSMTNRVSTVTPCQPLNLQKFIPQLGKHERRVSAVMFGLALSMGIANFPTQRIDTLAMANESDPDTASKSVKPVTEPSIDRVVTKLVTDISLMRSHPEHRPQVKLAQSISPKFQAAPVVDRTSTRSWQSSSQLTIPIDVPSPRSQQFQFVPNTQAYFNPNVTGPDGDLADPHNRFPQTKTGITNLGFAWPTKGTVTSHFGRRWGKMHQGIDIAAPVGTPVQAAADGTVRNASWHSGGYGNLIEVQHGDGTVTRYGHNSRLLVSVGQVVKQGQQIAEMGSTGHSTGSHLHFEIRPIGGSAVNPIALLKSNS